MTLRQSRQVNNLPRHFRIGFPLSFAPVISPFFALAMGFLVLASPAFAANFTGERGFSLTYPDSWMIATKQVQDEISASVKAILEKIGNTDFAKISVLVFNPVDDDFIENVNLVITPGRIPLDDRGLDVALEALAAAWAAQGTSLRNVARGVDTFGNNEALSIEYDVELYGQSMHQWIVAIPGKDRTYIITSSALSSEFDEYAETFRNIVYSVELDTGFWGIWLGLPQWLRYALIGGAIGLGISLVRSVFRRKKSGA